MAIAATQRQIAIAAGAWLGPAGLNGGGVNGGGVNGGMPWRKTGRKGGVGNDGLVGGKGGGVQLGDGGGGRGGAAGPAKGDEEEGGEGEGEEGCEVVGDAFGKLAKPDGPTKLRLMRADVLLKQVRG